MEWVNTVVYIIGFGISRLLEPALGPLEQLHLFLKQELTAVHVPYEWQDSVITAGWVIVLFLVFRALKGFMRVLFVLLTAAVLAKVYGVLPPA